jgi:Predicted transcriptional regulator containing an HTH domain and an uncharacterized domain shared with the mammalian protein Schlafen
MENKNIEWKKNWRSEYLKEVCAFSNSKTGGILRIGVDDDGNIVGIDKPKDTLKDMSDTTINKLGIFPDINIDENTNVITVVVSPSPVPLDIDGKYYVRMGNTTQELKGRDKERFLAERLGISWMDLPVEGSDISMIDRYALDIFRKKAAKKGTISEENLNAPDEELLTKLKLMVDGKLTRTAILLFHPDPEDAFEGSYVKIGMFDGSELLYQDWISCPLILMPDKIMDILKTKYMKWIVTYEGITRIENEPYPEKSLRECILNMVMHNDYSSRIPMQIRVWDEEKMMITDYGSMPGDWTLETLLSSHDSAPFNPTLAKVFAFAGYVETWGRGIERIIEGYSDRVNMKPEFRVHSSSFSVTLKNRNAGIIPSSTRNDRGKVMAVVSLTPTEKEIYKIIVEGKYTTAEDVASSIGSSVKTVRRSTDSLSDIGLIRRVGSDKKGNWEAIPPIKDVA